jgi:tRNA (cmo5U34)-methyltransferase
MREDELRAAFDRQAAGYDEQWEKMAPIRDGLYLLVEAMFAELPADARVLSVGLGTGAELAHLARRFPRWSFTAVEPSGPMLDLCRQRAEREGFASRCTFHEGYLDSLPTGEGHHAATCFLVSQFILDQGDRSDFFRAIADRLQPGGMLASSDLASGAGLVDYEALLRAWLIIMAGPDVSAERLERARSAYAKDVAILAPATVASVIEAGGFEPPVQFFQAGLLHAWFSKRA